MNHQQQPEDPTDRFARLFVSLSAPQHDVVLLDGPPLSGVTRTMLEAVRRHLPHWRLAPFTAADLAQFCEQSDFKSQFTQGKSYILWLDDLSPADLVLLGQGVLEKVLPHALVLASINTAWCNTIQNDSSAVTGPGRTILEYAHRISVPFAMTPSEKAALRRMGYPVSIGIAESLVGGEVLIERYRGSDRDHPAGNLLVQAAVDARRCGIHRPLTADELYRLWYARTNDASRRSFRRALDWASDVPQGASTGLLFRAAGGEFEEWRVLGYAAGADNGDHNHTPRALSRHAWSAVREQLPRPADQFSIAIAAHLHGREDVAKRSLSDALQAAGSRHTIGAAAASALQHIDDSPA